MHVGVFLENLFSAQIGRSLPHARGGVSGQEVDKLDIDKSSPCTWGCFYIRFRLTNRRRVFPMHVGVFLCMLYTA